MGDFFHGWRRKIGVLTLVMACVFAVGWVRSLYVTDFIMLNVWEVDGSSGGSLIFGRYFFSSLTPALPLWDIRPTADIGDFTDLFSKWILPDRIDWGFRACGFGICDIADDQGGLWVRLLIVPYWSIVIPLTLLSAYLLLVKPRSKPPKKSD